MRYEAKVEVVNVDGKEVAAATFYAGRYGHLGVLGVISTDNLPTQVEAMVGEVVMFEADKQLGRILDTRCIRVEEETVCDDNFPIYDVLLTLTLDPAIYAGTTAEEWVKANVGNLRLLGNGRSYTIPGMGVITIDFKSSLLAIPVAPIPEGFLERVQEVEIVDGKEVEYVLYLPAVYKPHMANPDFRLEFIREAVAILKWVEQPNPQYSFHPSIAKPMLG